MGSMHSWLCCWPRGHLRSFERRRRRNFGDSSNVLFYFEVRFFGSHSSESGEKKKKQTWRPVSAESEFPRSQPWRLFMDSISFSTSSSPEIRARLRVTCTDPQLSDQLECRYRKSKGPFHTLSEMYTMTNCVALK